MRLVYLSAPYTTGPDSTSKRQADIDAATAQLMAWTDEYYIFSPITYEKPLKDIYGENKSWEFWGPRDAAMVARCDELWVLCLNNWENSKGVKFEMEKAKELGKPIWFIHYVDGKMHCKWAEPTYNSSVLTCEGICLS